MLTSDINQAPGARLKPPPTPTPSSLSLAHGLEQADDEKFIILSSVIGTREIWLPRKERGEVRETQDVMMNTQCNMDQVAAPLNLSRH